MSPVPAIIVCGFLGAGKTTLVKRLLGDPQGVRFGVLLNDFGAIDIEGGRLDADRIVLQNGCICCAVNDDFTDALDRLLEGTPRPDRIIIETSGVSRPLPVADAVTGERFRGRIRLDGIYCMVDTAGFGGLDFADTELAIDQAVGADLVVLNKADLAGPAGVVGVEATLMGAMPKMRALSTSNAELPREVLFAGSAHHGGHHHHHHDHDEAWETWHWQSPAALDEGRLRRALRSLPAGVLRAKGVGGGVAFQAVGKRVDVVREAVAAGSAAVAIGRRGAFDPEVLTRLFEGCVDA